MFLNYICTVDYQPLMTPCTAVNIKHAISQFVYTCCDYESNWEGSWLCFVVVCMCVAPNVLFNRRCQSGILLCGCAQQSSSETHWGIFQIFNLIFTIWKFKFMQKYSDYFVVVVVDNKMVRTRILLEVKDGHCLFSRPWTVFKHVMS